MGLLRLFFSSRTPTWAKWVFGLLALFYLASPWDAIPDIFLGPGFIDDLVVVPLLLWLGTRFAWRGDDRDPDDTSPGRKTVKNEAPPRAKPAAVDERSPGMRREA